MSGTVKSFLTIVLALLFAAPFFVYEHTPPIATFYAEWLAAMIGVVYCAALLFQSSSSGQVVFPRVAALPLLLAAVLAKQMIAGEVIYGGMALISLLSLLLAMLITWLVANHQRSVEDNGLVETLVITLVIVGVLCVAISLIQLLYLDTPFNGVIAWGEGGYVYANVGQKNHYGTLMALALVALVWRVAMGSRWWLAVLLLPLTFGLSLSGSRSVWIYLALALVASLRLPSHCRSERRKIAALLVVAAVAVLVNDFILPILNASFASGLGRIVGEGYSGIAVRLAMWREALLAIANHPLSGMGFQGASYWHFIVPGFAGGALFPAGFDDIHLENYHNLILHLGVEFGLPGLILGLALASYVAALFWRIRSPRDWLLATLVGVLFCHAMLEYPLHYLFYLLIFAVLLGLTEWRHSEFAFRDSLRKTLGVVVVIAGTFVSITIFNAYRHIESIYVAARQGELRFSVEVRDALRQASAMGFLQPYVDAAIHYVDPKDVDSRFYPAILMASERAMHFQTSVRTVKAHINKLEAFGYPEQAAELRGQAQKAYQSFLANDIGK